MDKPNIKFPKPPKKDVRLRLELNKPANYAIQTKKQIENIINKSRAPWGGDAPIMGSELQELEKSPRIAKGVGQAGAGREGNGNAAD